MFKTAHNNTEQILVYTAFPLTIICPIPKKCQCTLGYKQAIHRRVYMCMCASRFFCLCVLASLLFSMSRE